MRASVKTKFVPKKADGRLPRPPSWPPQTRHGLIRWQGAAATPLSPAPRLPASLLTIAHRYSSAFPHCRFSLCATPLTPFCHLKAPESRRIPRRFGPPQRHVNASASWNAPALHRFSLPHRSTAHAFPPGAWRMVVRVIALTEKR